MNKMNLDPQMSWSIAMSIQMTYSFENLRVETGTILGPLRSRCVCFEFVLPVWLLLLPSMPAFGLAIPLHYSIKLLDMEPLLLFS